MAHGTAQALAGLGGKSGFGHGDVANPNKAVTTNVKPSNFVRVVLVEGQNERGWHGTLTTSAGGTGTNELPLMPTIDVDGMAVGDELVFFGVIRANSSAASRGQFRQFNEAFIESRDVAIFKCIAGGLDWTTEADASQEFGGATRVQNVKLDDRDDYSDAQYLIVYLDLTP